MSKLKLIKISNKNVNMQDNITLQPPVIIGRGSLLKCPDKKVSRDHASIDWDNDGILLTSIHTNPTYIKINEEIKPLKWNDSVILKNNDQFGLLKEAYWFKVCLETSLDSKEKSNIPKIPKIVNVVVNNESDHRSAIPLQDLQNTKDFDINLNNDVKDVDCDVENNDPVKDDQIKVDVKNVVEEPLYKSDRTRKLPKWLTESKSPGELKEVKLKNSPHGRIKKDTPSTQNSLNNKKNMPNKNSSEAQRNLHSVSDDDESSPKKNEDDSKAKRTPIKSPKKAKRTPIKRPMKGNQYHAISLEYDDEEPEGNDHAISDEESSDVNEEDKSQNKKRDSTQKTDGSQPAAKRVKIDIPQAKKKSREACQYGASCYRKNPDHREQFSHPGDEDYSSPIEDDDSEDERPQCEYGIECYRKNPQHRKAYKHSRIPQPRRRTTRKKRKTDGDDYDSEDDYDFDDPFLNDDSTDDYAPTDDDDSDTSIDADAAEEDDNKRMLKEAKKFIKKTA